ncbi:MAG: DEAD/DEAH box helicase family protein [Clostridia bacterium]
MHSDLSNCLLADELTMLRQENQQLRQENQQLRQENQRLHAVCLRHGIDASPNPAAQLISNTTSIHAQQPCVTKKSCFSDKASLFLSLFRGRQDVYARQWQNKEGRIGYSPACKNEWVHGMCGKPKQKCADCSNAAYLPYHADAIRQHLNGECVIGIYPLMKEETCTFLAIDFDEENWRADIRTVAEACTELAIPCYIEVSRSGNGAHLWFFFDAPVEASLARTMGTLMLTKAMEKRATLTFSSYDRMFPNQDTMPKGGFGNLIALPFQPMAFRRGGCVFVDEQYHPFEDQWVLLSSIQKIPREQLEACAVRQHGSPLGQLRIDTEESDSKPWDKKAIHLTAVDFPPSMQAVMADQLYLPTTGLSNKAQNQIKRLAAFRNPQFYQAQAMRMPIWDKPRVICCAEYRGEYLCLPRGCKEQLVDLVKKCGASIIWQDERQSGKAIDVTFTGVLREEQEAALTALLAHDDGILSATTAFGKTVVGAALIAQRKVNTLILVHRKQLLTQWKERLGAFLEIHDQLPEAPQKRGRKKIREIIGTFGGGKDTRGGIVDIAIMQSMGAADAIKPWIGDYGMVLVDECHHVPAVSFEQVLKGVRAKYVYGLTATPTRQDGHHPILTMYLGNIRHRVNAKEQAEKQPFAHVMIPRFTGASFCIDQETKIPAIGQYYARILEDDLRNHMIVDDVLTCVKEGRSCLLLSERTRHVEMLSDLLKNHVKNVMVMTGGKTNTESARQLERLRNAPTDQPLVICATGKYIGEGFDEARLDTLFLTMPISWHGTLAQYAGRLHRLYDAKREVRVYDYVDSSVEMLERMYHKRLKGYAAIGYQVAALQQGVGMDSDIIYDQNTFQPRFLFDLNKARKSIVIVSPYITMKRVRWLEECFHQAIERRVSITVITRPAGSFQGHSGEAVSAAIQYVTHAGINVRCREAIHQKYAIVDDVLVWYGSINLLSFGASQESIMRLASGSIARALQRG